MFILEVILRYDSEPLELESQIYWSQTTEISLNRKSRFQSC